MNHYEPTRTRPKVGFEYDERAQMLASNTRGNSEPGVNSPCSSTKNTRVWVFSLTGVYNSAYGQD